MVLPVLMNTTRRTPASWAAAEDVKRPHATVTAIVPLPLLDGGGVGGQVQDLVHAAKGGLDSGGVADIGLEAGDALDPGAAG